MQLNAFFRFLTLANINALRQFSSLANRKVLEDIGNKIGNNYKAYNQFRIEGHEDSASNKKEIADKLYEEAKKSYSIDDFTIIENSMGSVLDRDLLKKAQIKKTLR